MQYLIGLLLTNAKVKLGAGLASGSGIFALVIYLHGDISKNIISAETRAKSYTDKQVLSFKSEIKKDFKHSKDRQKEIIETLKVIEHRQYNSRGK